MTDYRAADLPVGSVVATDDTVWIARRGTGGRWEGFDSNASDASIDAAIANGARVLRVGTGTEGRAVLVTISHGTPNGLTTIHRAGCRDLAREPYESRRDMEAATRKEVALSIYPPASDDYDPTEEWEQYEDFLFKPCVRALPSE